MGKSRLLSGAIALFIATAISPVAHAAVSHDPVGHFDKARYDTRTNKLQVGGWAADPDLGSQPGQRVMVSIDGKDVKSLATGSYRPDVARHYPHYGSHTGFARVITVPKARGNHSVCIRAINRGAGNKVSVLLGCKTFNVTVPGTIIGHIDKAQYVTNGTEVQVIGWTLDPYDDISPTPFFPTGPEGHDQPDVAWELINLQPTPLPRPDVDRQFPNNGSKHGFNTTFPTFLLERLGVGDVICLAKMDGWGPHWNDPEITIPYGQARATRFCATIKPGVIDPP